MAEIKWIKIVTDMFDDEKILLIETLPDGDSILVIWLKLLCLAGKQNNSGVFSMQNGLPYTDKMLSIIFRRKEATVQLALQTFQSFGMIEIIENTITIPNWGKHQNFDTIERKNEYMRGYMQEYRARQKQIASGSEHEKRKTNVSDLRKSNVSCADKIRLDKNRIDNTNTPSKKSTADYCDSFNLFWDAYPNKVGKAAAAKSFSNAVKKVSISVMLEAVADYCNSDKVKRGIICNPATWLNQERWSDEAPIIEDDYNGPSFEELVAMEEACQAKLEKEKSGK